VSYIWRTIVDAINALPFCPVMAIVGMLGQGVTGILLAIALTNWARYARLARAELWALRRGGVRPATRILGTPASATLLRHIIPNVYAETAGVRAQRFCTGHITIAGLSSWGRRAAADARMGAMMTMAALDHQRPWITCSRELMVSATAISIALLAERIIGRARGESF